jgi:DNA-directed RNA polymerase specialized sigma24 family protein
VLVLRYLCDLTDDDVAATLGTSTGTVRSQAARGLATLRRRHTRNGAPPDDESTQELVLSHPEGNPR